MLERRYNNCLVRPADMAPSDDRMEVLGTFNPGATAFGDGVVLLVRVAERPREKREGFVALPRCAPGGRLEIDWVREEEIAFLDPRVVEFIDTGRARLTFLSHLVVMHSRDGRRIDRIESTRFLPETEYETFGVEDPRIVALDGRYYFTYVAVSEHGACTALASTRDFSSFERHGILFPCDNKDVLLFPEKVAGEYLAFHRPSPASHFRSPEMWLARSRDLLRWGRHEIFHAGSGLWESGRIGGGAPPFKTDEGWLEIYHGNGKRRDDPGVGVYSAGALLLDLEAPGTVLRRSPEPFMVPEAPFERKGFVPDVVFPTGVVQREDLIQVYYGAADENTGVVEFSLADLLKTLG